MLSQINAYLTIINLRIKIDPNSFSRWVCTVTGKLQFLLILLWCSYASSMPCHCHLLLVLLSSTFVQRLRSSEKRETFKAGGDSVKWVMEFLLTDTNWDKAELLQLKPHPFIYMTNFINKKVGKSKKLSPLLLYQF